MYIVYILHYVHCVLYYINSRYISLQFKHVIHSKLCTLHCTGISINTTTAITFYCRRADLTFYCRRRAVSEREGALRDLRTRFARNRQILSANWQQAEEEVRKLDDIYHETVGRVLDTLAALGPEVVAAQPGLKALTAALQQAVDGANGNGTAAVTNLKSRSEGRLSRSMVSDGGNMSRSLLIEDVAPSGLRPGVYSEPCLVKSPLLNPSLLGSPTSRIQAEVNCDF